MRRELKNFLKYGFKRKKAFEDLLKILKKNKYLVILSLLYFFSVIFLVQPWVHGNDGAGYYAPLRSLVIDGNLNLSNEYDFFEKSQPVPISAITENNETGMWYSQYPIGTALAWVPFFLIAHGISLLFGLPTTGYTNIYYWFVNIGSSLLAFGAVFASFFFLKKRFNEQIAFWSVLTGFLATNLVYYTFIEATMSHAVQFFVVTLFLLLWFTLREKQYLKWFILGLFASWIFMVRLQDGILWLLPAVTSLLWYIQYIRKNEWKSVLPLLYGNLLFVVGILIALIPQLLVNSAYHHSVLTFVKSYTGSFVASQWWFGLNVLFSSDSGLFFWTPIAFLGILGLFLKSKYIRSSQRWQLLLVFVLQVIITGFWNGWNSAQSFGQRFFVGYVFLFMLGLSILQERIPWKKLLQSIFIVYIVFNGILLIQYGLRMIPSFGPLDTSLVLRNLGKFPEMISRFLEFLKQ